MGVKDILVVLDRAQHADALALYSHALAEAFQAHITVIGLVQDLQPPATYLGEFPYELARGAQDAQMSAIATAYARFEQAAPRPDGCEFVRIETQASNAPETVAKLARHFDMTIAMQTESEANKGEGDILEGLLFRSGRPAMIVPYIHHAPARLDKVLVAWDGGATAARALADSLPLLKRAGKVEIVTMIGLRHSAMDLPGVDVARHLARHGVSAELKTLPKGENIGALLLSYAADENADLMVMGGYGHSRIREFILGGATRTVLSSMTLPIFMAH